MSQFQNLHELILYFSHCVLCNKSRPIEFLFDKVDYLQINNYQLSDTNVKIELKYIERVGFEDDVEDGVPVSKIIIPISIFIDIIKSTYNCEAGNFINEFGIEVEDTSNFNLDISFFIESKCKDCGSYIRSRDVEIETSDSTEYFTQLETDIESFYLIKTSDKYKVTHDPDESFLLVQKLKARKSVNWKNRHSKIGKPIRLPLYNFDFSDETKAIVKLKTYITFS